MAWQSVKVHVLRDGFVVPLRMRVNGVQNRREKLRRNKADFRQFACVKTTSPNVTVKSSRQRFLYAVNTDFPTEIPVFCPLYRDKYRIRRQGVFRLFAPFYHTYPAPVQILVPADCE